MFRIDGIIHGNAEYMSRKTLALKPIEKWKQCQMLTKTTHIHAHAQQANG